MLFVSEEKNKQLNGVRGCFSFILTLDDNDLHYSILLQRTKIVKIESEKRQPNQNKHLVGFLLLINYIRLTFKLKQDTEIYFNMSNKEYTFFDDVFEVVAQIPKGRVTSYGAIAKYLGTKMSARMVGWAMNASHHSTRHIPAQRVVNRNGMLTGKAHFATPTLMEELLKKDGVEILNDTVIDFKNKFWDPAVELGM